MDNAACFRKKVIKINRNELRSYNQELDKNREWFRRLPDSKKKFIGYFVEQKVIENDNFVAAIMDKCVMAAIDDNTNLEIIDQKKIIAEGNVYIAEYKEYLDKNREEGFNMIEDTKLREKVKEAIRGCIADKIDKAKSLNKLRKDFKLPAAELSNLWIEVKKEDGIVYHEPKEENKPISEEKEVRQVITHLKEEKAVEETTGKQNERIKYLNNIFKPTKFQGAWNSYEKLEEGLKVGTEIFKSLNEVEEYKNQELATMKKQIELFESKIEETKAAFEYLNMR